MHDVRGFLRNRRKTKIGFFPESLDYTKLTCFKLCGQTVDLLCGRPPYAAFPWWVSWQDNEASCEHRITSKEMTENKSIWAGSHSSTAIRNYKTNYRNITMYPCYFTTPNVTTAFMSRYRTNTMLGKFYRKFYSTISSESSQIRRVLKSLWISLWAGVVRGSIKKGRISSEQIRSKKRPSGRKPNNKQKALNRSIE